MYALFFAAACDCDEGDVEPIKIRTAAQLDKARKKLSCRYVLTADISLKSYANWEPIGTVAEPFRGSFDGNGHTIADLKIRRSTEDDVGLFGCVEGGQLTNISLENSDIIGRHSVGGIVGRMHDSTLTNSYNKGQVAATEYQAGGIAGSVTGMRGSEITNSYSAGEVSAAKGNVGGIAGGMWSSKITNSYSTGKVTGNQAGGIVGGMWNSEITNSYGAGEVSAKGSRAGGIAGFMMGSTLTHCAAMNPSIRSAELRGRIVGDIEGTADTVQDNFAWSEMVVAGGATVDGSAKDGLGKTEAALKAQPTYANTPPGGLGWDFTSTWKMPTGGGYPLLHWQ
jgi:hypothetical protein